MVDGHHRDSSCNSTAQCPVFLEACTAKQLPLAPANTFTIVLPPASLGCTCKLHPMVEKKREYRYPGSQVTLAQPPVSSQPPSGIKFRFKV